MNGHTEPTTCLITGANRGIGRGLVAAYLLKPNHIVVAAVRDPNDSTSRALYTLKKAPSSQLIVVKIESTSETDAQEAATSLTSQYGITALDIVIANAGISKVLPSVAQAQPKDMMEHFQINVVGPVLLFQAVYPLLQRSKKTPRFVALGTSAATITDMEQRNFPNAAYGTSKAALNYVVKKMHLENPGIIAFPVDPGWVQTDMGNGGARLLGLESAEITIEKSIEGLITVIECADRENTSGKFLNYRGKVCAW